MHMKLMITAFFIVFINLVYSQNDFKITIKINGIKNDTVMLANYYGNQTYIFDRAKIDSKGTAVFNLKNGDMPRGLYILVYKSQRVFDIISDTKSFTMETDTSDIVGNMKIKNSKENTLFYEYLMFLNKKNIDVFPIREKYAKLLKEKNKKDEQALLQAELLKVDNEVRAYIKEVTSKNTETFFATFLNANQEVEIPDAPLLANGRPDSSFAFRYFKQHYWDNFNLKDNGLVRTVLYHSKLDYYIKKLTYQIPDSLNFTADIIVNKVKKAQELYKYTVWYITNQYEGSDIMGMDAVFEHMVTNYFGYDKTPWIDSTTLFKMQDKARKLTPLLLGKKAPNMILKDTNGVYKNLASVNAKYTVLYFYDPDCGTCQKVTPVLAAKYDSLKAIGAEVFSVSSTSRGEYKKWTDYINKINMKWISVADPDFQSNHRYEYNLESYPQIFVLDSQKKILAKRLVVDQLLGFIKQVDQLETYGRFPKK